MEPTVVMPRAAAAAVDVVRGIGPDELDRPTPCTELNVRALLNHLIFWTGVRGYGAGLKQPPQPGEVEQGHDFTAEPSWAEAYAARAAATAEVWSDPETWTGETSLTGNGRRMPAGFVGGILLCEWLLHGWDLAVATGQKLTVDDDLAAALHEDVAGRAEMARQYGAFGPEVDVPSTAPLFDRVLGLAGRDPEWRREA
jgi:uncharacterized protein (TIGR03086 family)